MFALSYILWHSLQLLPIAIVIAGALVTATVYLYRPQVRGLSRTWRWVLPALRVAALVALVASILKPVAIRPRDEQEQGAVILLVDRSKSMSVSDAGRTPAQLVAIADGLGRLAAGTRTAPTGAIKGDVDKLLGLADEVAGAYSEAEYSRLTGRGIEAADARVAKAIENYKTLATKLATDAAKIVKPPQLAQQIAQLVTIPNPGTRDAWQTGMRQKIDAAGTSLDNSQKAADEELYKSNAEVRKVCDAIAQLTRFELVEESLTDPTNGLLAKLPKKSPLYGFGVADDVTPIALRSGDTPVKRLMIQPGGRATDLASTARAAIDQVKGQSIQAVVLLSDGRQVSRSDETAVSSLSATGVPIFTVPAAGTVARDVSIARVSIPASAFVDETMTTRVDLRGVGIKGKTVEVSLTIGDGAAQVQKVAFADEAMIPVTFETKLIKPGAKDVHIDVKPIEGEESLDNNSARRYVKVQADKIKVTLLAGAPGWDYQYLRNSLARTPWVKLQDFILDTPDTKLTLDADQLREQDVIVLSDVPVASLSEQQWDAIHRTVTDRGGSVILLAGNAHMPGEYSQNVLLSSFLPYRDGISPTWRAWPGEEPFFHIIPAKGAETIDALKLGDDPAQFATRWQQLPAFYRYLPITDLKPNTRALLVERESAAPVLTESRLGIGRVFFLGADETWRWRYKVGERDQDRFWLQLIRYAAEEPYSVQQGGVSLDADKVAIAPREPVRVRAKVMEASGMASKSHTQELKIVRGGQNIRTQAMDPVGGAEGTGRYDTIVTDLDEGDYKLQIASGTGTAPLEFPLHVVSSDESEMADLTGDDAMLKHLADASGGEVVQLSDLRDLPERLAKIQDTRTRIAEQPLWDSYYLFLFVLACLGAEWALRKRYGLA